MQKMKLYDHLDNISVGKRILSEEELKSYSPFMINKFVASSDLFLPVVEQINHYNLPKDAHQRFMQGIIPKRKQYFKYIKAKKTNDEFALRCIKLEYEVGDKEASQYIDMLTEEQINFIVDKYHYLQG
jgi:hypothetical protein